MPGELKRDAACPVCGDPLLYLVDSSNSHGVIRTYYHERNSPKARRRRPCVQGFNDHDVAHRARLKLEKPYPKRRK
jgi:hypothetical protein